MPWWARAYDVLVPALYSEVHVPTRTVGIPAFPACNQFCRKFGSVVSHTNFVLKNKNDRRDDDNSTPTGGRDAARKKKHIKWEMVTMELP
jgi:hypothetical protein